MATRAPYGDWNAYTEDTAPGVVAAVTEFLDEFEQDYDISVLADAYRALINAALPAEISLDGDQFFGPYPVPPGRSLDVIQAAIDSVQLWELSTLYDQAALLDEVWVYEDNSGAVYLGNTNGMYAFALGPVTPDMHGRAARDAAGWNSSKWAPWQTCTPEPIGNCTHIATWTPDGGLVHVRGDNGERVAGAGGSLYLGPSPVQP